MKIGKQGATLIYKCGKCGKLQNNVEQNVVVISTPPGTKWLCSKCSGTGQNIIQRL